jgi:hypothetical protein
VNKGPGIDNYELWLMTTHPLGESTMSAAARNTLRMSVVSGLRCRQTECHYEADEGYDRTQPADRVDAEVPLASLWPVLRWRIDLPAHENVVDRLGGETRRQDRAAPENASRPSALSTNAALPGFSCSSASAPMGTKPEVNTRA